MKSLSQFIAESDVKTGDKKQTETKSAPVVTFDLNGIDGGADVLNSIKSICASASIKQDTSNLNIGIKITVTRDKADELEKIAEVVQEFISSIPDEEHDEISGKLSKLSSSLDKLNDILDDYSNEEE